MRLLHLVIGTLGVLTLSGLAQDKPPRKKMVFQPGAKVPDGAENSRKDGGATPAAGNAGSKTPEPAAAAASAANKPAGDAGRDLTVPPRPSDDLPPVDVRADDAPTRLAANFFNALAKGDVDGAYDHLTKGSKIAERPEESKALRAKTREALEVFGALTGFQLLESKDVGPRLLRRTYVSMGREFPLRWRFYFYKPEQTWRLVDLRVDDRLGGIFGEAEESRPDTKP